MAATLLKSTAKGIVKVGVAAGAVYVTVEKGIWSTSLNPSASALTEAKGTFIEYSQKVPSASRAAGAAGSPVVEAWNSGVKYVCTSIAEIPDTVQWMANAIKGSTK